MSRYKFQTNREYAAFLHASQPRRVENSNPGYQLLRLEFEIFELLPDELRSTGKIACRDIIVGQAVNPELDSSLTVYAKALRIERPRHLESWTNSGRQIWVALRFGPIDASDQRNSFLQISPLDIGNRRIIAFRYDLTRGWVTVSDAAARLRLSAATIRRRLSEFEPEWGNQLVTRTEGNHRRVNLPLLRSLLFTNP